MTKVDLCENPITNIPSECFSSTVNLASLCASTIPLAPSTKKGVKGKTSEAESALPAVQNLTLVAPTAGAPLPDEVIDQIHQMHNLDQLTIGNQHLLKRNLNF